MKKTFNLTNLREIAMNDGSLHQLSLTEQSIVKFLRDKNLEALSYVSETEDPETALSIFCEIFKKDKFTGKFHIIKNEISLDDHELDLDIILSGKIKSAFPENQTEFLNQYGVEEVLVELFVSGGSFMVKSFDKENLFKEAWDKGVSAIKNFSINNSKSTQDYTKVAAMVALGFSMTACSKDVSKIGSPVETPKNPAAPIVDLPATDEKVMTMVFANHGSNFEIPSAYVSTKNITMVIAQEIENTSFDRERSHPNLLLTMNNFSVAEYKWNGSQYVLSSVASSDKIKLEVTASGTVYTLKVSDQSSLRVRYIPAGQTLSMSVKYWE